MPRHRGPAIRSVVSLAAVAAVSAAALAATPSVTPAEAATPSAVRTISGTPATAPAKPSVRTVTLVTGDQVVLRTDSAGRSIASFTPRSPHVGMPYLNAAFADHHYVVPRLSAAQLRVFDPSVFDVSALAGQTRTTLDVTFAKGVAARSLPGLDVRRGSAHTTADGRTTVQASYDASRPLPARLATSLGSVARIRVAGAAAPQLDPSYALHTLTVDATSVNHTPIGAAETFVLNLDDGRLFSAMGVILNGQWKVEVPSGHYVVLVDNSSHVALTQATVDSTDATASLSLANATVKPSMSFPDHSSLSPEVDLLFADAAGTSSSEFGFGGLLPKLQPVAGLAAGTVTTEVSDSWSTKGFKPYVFHHQTFHVNPLTLVANAKEARAGVPQRLSYRYRASDFATVRTRYYATGRPLLGLAGWVGITPEDRLLFFDGVQVRRPGVVTVMFLARPDLRWMSDAQLTVGFRHFVDLDVVHRYPRPVHTALSFFRAPLTPVVDAGGNSGSSGPGCQLCVHDGTVRGSMSMISSAGTDQLGFADRGRWSLQNASGTVAQGRGYINPRKVAVTAGTRMALTAELRPEEPQQLLSRQVSDAWTFRVPAANGPVPILRAQYVVPTDLAGRAPAGTVRFPVRFDNLGPAAARVAGASFQFSADGGASWHGARVRRRDKNTFEVSFADPVATRAHHFLSIRLAAQDSGGRAVLEAVQNAAFLPGASGAPRAIPTGTASSHGFRPHRLCASSTWSAYSCLVQLDPATLAAGESSPDPQGWGAPALRDAYDLPDTGATSTVGVVVAFDYPTAEADLNKYRRQFGLPPCTSASGCFTKINQRGQTGSYPEPDQGWGVEASLDLQMISAACPTCHIVLAEANQPSDHAFDRATMAAIGAGATVTNHSYSRIELTGTDTADTAYAQPGVTAVAAAGDTGYGPAGFPASSPSVVAVGGTTLQRSLTPRGWTERAWSQGGSGCSAYFAKPAWQSDPACPGRTTTDLSAVAHGLAIYNTSVPRRLRGWLEVDGTSASSPLVAGMIGAAGAGGMRPSDLYGHPGEFNDVTSGANGYCLGSYLCTAGVGYDGPTGWGSPAGLAAFQQP